MPRWRQCVVWAALTVLLVGARAQGQESKAEATLTFRSFQSLPEMVDFTWGGVEEFLGFRNAQKGYTAPKMVGKPTFFTVKLEWMNKPVTGVLGKSAASVKSFDRVWFDWNGDKKFADDEGLKGSESKDFAAFGPIERTGADGKKCPAFCFLVHGGDHIHLCPPGYYEGTVTLNGRAVKMAAVDRNVNGVYGERGTEEEPGDVLLVDCNGDGKFAELPDEYMAQAWSIEPLPLMRLMQMPDGNFYRVTVAEDGSRLTLERDATPTGRVKVACSRFVLGLMGEDGPLWVRATGNEVALPAGSYRVQWVTAGAEDKDGKCWSALINFRRSATERLRVTADQTTELNFGPPFQLSLEVEESEDVVFAPLPSKTGNSKGSTRIKRTVPEYSFSLSLKDKAGNDVSDVLTPDVKRPPEPELKIVNSAGKAVKSEKFHYG